MERTVLTDSAGYLGFDAVGVAPVACLLEEETRLKAWLEKGMNAGMRYMADNLEKRVDPRLLVEDTRSVIVTLTNYYTTFRQQKGNPVIAKYALGKDYHLVIRDRLRKLLEAIRQGSGEEISGRCFTDSAPIFEHEWARRAGLGWQGKNTLILNRELGSFCFIGVILTNAKFDTYSDPFTAGYCGTCSRCVEACPTGALTPYQVDARKCISYNTIEKKDDYPEALKKLAGGRIFGCDACQDVCPWNRKARQHRNEEFFPRDEIRSLTQADWLDMDRFFFKRLFKGTPLERTGLSKIKMNINGLCVLKEDSGEC